MHFSVFGANILVGLFLIMYCHSYFPQKFCDMQPIQNVQQQLLGQLDIHLHHAHQKHSLCPHLTQGLLFRCTLRCKAKQHSDLSSAMSPAQHLPELQVTHQTTVILKDCLYQQICKKEKKPNNYYKRKTFLMKQRSKRFTFLKTHHILQNVTALRTGHFQLPFCLTGSRAFSLSLIHKQDVKLICYHVKEIGTS